MVKRARVTLSEVAAAAGVSPTTASLVLSGRGRELRISGAVEESVRAAAGELGYRRNMLSVGLRKGASHTIGFVSDTVATSQLAGDMIQGAIDATRERGYMVFIGETGGNAEDEEQLLNAMLDRQVDGFILSSMFTRPRSLPGVLANAPVALLNAVPTLPPPVDVVIPDEVAAGRAAARLLLDAGHREIHLVGVGLGPDGVPPDTVAGLERRQGILDVMTAAGLAPASGQKCADWLPPFGWSATRAILDDFPSPKALICFNDRLAFGAYQALNEAGLSIPSDVSIVSFDDYPLADWLRPGLTSFAIPHMELGRRAAEIVLDQIQAGGKEHTRQPSIHRLRMPLRERESIARPRR